MDQTQSPTSPAPAVDPASADAGSAADSAAAARGTDRVTCETPTGAEACVNVVTFADPGSRVAAFNTALAAQGKAERVATCELVVDLPAGIGGGNHNYGGYCALQQGAAKAMICYDEMVGNFALKAEGDAATAKDLIDFTYESCVQA